MTRFFLFFRKHWFGLLTSIILLVGFLFFLLILLSPRYDIQKRGFIPCTEELAQNLQVCLKQKEYSCIFDEIMKNSWCDAKVIGSGFKSWIKGEQSAPWSNYIFKPELPEANEPDELDAEFYAPENHPELDLLRLKKLNDILEQNNSELDKQQEKIQEETVEPEQQKEDDPNDKK